MECGKRRPEVFSADWYRSTIRRRIPLEQNVHQKKRTSAVAVSHPASNKNASSMEERDSHSEPEVAQDVSAPTEKYESDEQREAVRLFSTNMLEGTVHSEPRGTDARRLGW